MTSTTHNLVIATFSLVALAFVATPALALCKIGSPHCPNPQVGPKAPTINSNRLPDGPPGNEDCKYFDNCDDGSPEGTGSDGNPNGGLGNGGSPAVILGHPGHLHPMSGNQVLLPDLRHRGR
jgi:hypothetical protein